MNRRQKKSDKPADRLLSEWDASIEPALMHKLQSLSDRRAFIGGLLKGGAAMASLPLWAGLAACDRKDYQQSLMALEPWQTFATTQQQLLPDDGNGPSAEDINATLYLKFVLEAPDTDIDDKTFIFDGIKWLNALTDQQFGKSFASLDTEQQDQALKQIAGSNAGERWLSHLLLYLMEALLTDPVYGGNPDGIGWQWLQHQPGFPRPPLDKRYTELL